MTPLRLGFCLVFLATIAIVQGLLAPPALAENGMEWQFFQTNDPGNKSTRLIYGVPETDNVQVSGACVHSSSIGANFSIVTFGADIGDLENGKDTELRLSGGGFDHTLKGKIIRATGEEGLNGVEIDIGNDDPLWRAFAEKESLDYLVPGYKAASLDFTRGRDKIQQFVKACETFADATPPVASAAAGGGDDAEKEAFDSAKELGTVEAWEAFIANYPSGFRADLARAYIKKLGRERACRRAAGIDERQHTDRRVRRVLQGPDEASFAKYQRADQAHLHQPIRRDARHPVARFRRSAQGLRQSRRPRAGYARHLHGASLDGH